VWDLVTMIMGPVLDVILAILDLIVAAWDRWGHNITTGTASAFTAILTIVSAIIGTIVTVITIALQVIETVFKVDREVIYTVVSVVLSGHAAIVQAIVAIIQGDLEGAWTAIKDQVVNILELIWHAVDSVFETFKEFVGHVLYFIGIKSQESKDKVPSET